MSEPGLFSSASRPLYDRLRPQSWESFHDFAGLSDLRERFIKKPFSLLLYGPPGTGKTTFLEILMSESGLPGVSLPATGTSLEEIRRLLKQHPWQLLLFLDEIQRFSKARQDFFLKPVEEGRLVLLGATTESPWQYLTRPLLSRMDVRQVKLPEKAEFGRVVTTSWHRLDLKPVPEAILNLIIEKTWPDFRSAFKSLETIYPRIQTNTPESEIIEALEAYFHENRQSFRGITSETYDLISAFIKSVRGSDPDAAVLYLARMLYLDVDPRYIARRLVILASEDIGLANSQGLLIARAAQEAVEDIGMPEARIILSQATIYLAASPKSNSAYLAIDQALDFVKKNDFYPPGHLCNHDPEIKKYKYPHDTGGYIDQSYWPEGLEKVQFYRPVQGRFENSLERRLAESLRKLKK